MSVMDTTGFAQVGKYGTLSLLKRQEPNTVVTSFGIDTEELTFGRDPKCSIRLYYSDVALTHCKIVFEERKAFLAVLGESGLLVDGCQVFPNSGSTSSPTMIPLSNNSEIEIRNKRFRFTYPPKDMRAVLFATPSPKNRKLRLSMIQSAEVFSPRPSNDPRENLRILQSPLKNRFKSPTKPSLLSRPPVYATPEPDEEEEIILVDGNRPRVVEEDRDLVILEDVEVPLIVVQPERSQPANYPPQTPPRRKSMARGTLHRAVLIRSAQRAVLRAEEEEEEMEVLETVVAEPEESDEDERDLNKPQDDGYTDMDVEMEDESTTPKNQPSAWRKSLERIWPFSSSNDDQDDDESDANASDEDENVPNEDYQEEDDDDFNEEQFAAGPAPLPTMTPVRRPLGSFLTPQARHATQTHIFNRNSPAPPVQTGIGRLSLGGGGEPRRVLMEQSWRVKDLVVPANAAGTESSTTPNTQTPRRPGPSDEEREAIRERRRSALREPDNFFAGGVPGMSPSKPSSSNFNVSPMKSSIPLNFSPEKGSAGGRRVSADEEDMDTRSLLEKMKETVEGMKRRRSVAPGGLGDGDFSPQRPTPTTPRQPLAPPVFSSVKKLNLTPAPTGSGDVQPITDDESEEEPTGEKEDSKDSFSLLRPQATEVVVAPKSPAPIAEPSDARPPVEIPMIVEQVEEEDAQGTTEDVVEEPTKTLGRARLLRSKKPSEDEERLTVSKPETRERSRSRSPRPRTPQPETKAKETPAEKPTLKAPAARRTRKKADEQEETPAAEPKASGRKTPSQTEEPGPQPGPARRGRKVASEPEESGPVKPAPVKRGRKPAVVKEEPEEEPVQPPKRTARKATAASTSASETSSTEAPARRVRTTRSTIVAPKKRVTKAATTEVIDADEAEEDPLDSIDSEAAEAKAAPVPTARGRGKKKAEVKDEEVEDAVPPPKVRGRAATALKTPAARTRIAKKTPATAPAAVAVGGDKENTPGSGSGSGSIPTTEDVIVKVKVSRSRGKTTGAAAAKVVVKEEAEEPARTRVMRTRMRTKTG